MGRGEGGGRRHGEREKVAVCWGGERGSRSIIGGGEEEAYVKQLWPSVDVKRKSISNSLLYCFFCSYVYCNDVQQQPSLTTAAPLSK